MTSPTIKAVAVRNPICRLSFASTNELTTLLFSSVVNLKSLRVLCVLCVSAVTR
jgi:hypothetical protein